MLFPARLPASATTFVSPNTMTVADLLATYPPSIATLGMYARVSDLWSSVDEVMRCRWDGVNYNWVPQRSADFRAASTVTTGALTITALGHAPVLDFTSTLVGSITPTLSPTNAWIGQTKVLRARGVLGIFGINVSGLVGGGTVPLLTGGDRTFVYTPTGWQA